MEHKRLLKLQPPCSSPSPLLFILKKHAPVPLASLFLPVCKLWERGRRHPRLLSLKGQALGTTWTVKLISSKPTGEDELQTELAAKIEKPKIFSHWRPDSKLYQINASFSDEPFSVPPCFTNCSSTRSGCISKPTAIDPTIAPLVNLWGFGPVPETG